MKSIKKHIDTDVKDFDLNLEESITYLIYRISNALAHGLRDDLGPTKISIQQWRVLSSLKSRNGLSTISELSACTVIKQPIISRIITEMQENGLVQKTQRKDDLRITEVRLTRNGNKLFEALLPIALRHRQRALENIDKTEIDELRKSLKQIQYNLGIKPINHNNR